MNIINDGGPEVTAALRQQEEHIKRSTSCTGQVGRAHAYRAHGNGRTGAAYSACIVCGVTETAADYATSQEGGTP